MKLPKEFQDRIDRFDRLFLTATNKSFKESNLYDYEMTCIKQAISFYDYFKEFSEDDFKSFVDNKSLYDVVMEIKDNLSFFDNGHSNNSLQSSWYLFLIYRNKPNMVQYMHGSLALLVGDEGYYDDRSDLPK